MSAMSVVGRPRAPLRGARAGGRQRWRARPQSQAARSCLTVFCALTSRAMKDKDFGQLCYVNVTNQLHGLVAMRALQNCGLSLPVEHDGASWLGQHMEHGSSISRGGPRARQRESGSITNLSGG